MSKSTPLLTCLRPAARGWLSVSEFFGGNLAAVKLKASHVGAGSEASDWILFWAELVREPLSSPPIRNGTVALPQRIRGGWRRYRCDG